MDDLRAFRELLENWNIEYKARCVFNKTFIEFHPYTHKGVTGKNTIIFDFDINGKFKGVYSE